MPIRLLLIMLLAAGTTLSGAQRAARPPLAPADVDDLATLLQLEDHRTFDADVLARLLRSTHPEVRRRTAMAIGHLADARGLDLLARARTDAPIAVEVAFAYGQIEDPAAIPWLAGRLVEPNVPASVRREAARSLGKIRTPASRAALESFLTAQVGASPAVGEALLALGRFPERGADLAPILRWSHGESVSDAAVTWQAAWALYRPRDPAAVPDLLRLSRHPDPQVRFWAVRGLGSPPEGVTPVVEASTLAARLREAVQDPDRRVRTEALRALATYDDEASFRIVLDAIDSPDPWLSVSAAEAMSRFASRREAIVPRLLAASAPNRPTSLRVTALAPLAALAPDRAVDLAAALAADPSLVARTTARQTLARLGDAGRARLESLPVDPEAPNPAPRGTGQGRRGGAPGGNAGRGGAPGRGAAPAPDTLGRTFQDYRQIVERWIVPAWRGDPEPVALWETPRGPIELHLHAADAPLGMEYLVRAIESGAIVGTEFGRLVPNFVAQQRTIAGAPRLRDEVNLHGLVRGNLSWASSGLDTGRPGYTLGHTPQPHNEGDFTSLGLVAPGSLDVIDRLELGDRITGARLLRR